MHWAAAGGGKWDNFKDQWRRVYDVNGISPTIVTNGGGHHEVKIAEPCILTPVRTDYGKSVRKQYEKGQVSESRHNMTELRPRDDGVCNTLTTVLKDNLLAEPCIGALRGRNPDNPSDRTSGAPTQQVLEINQSGCSNTLTTVQKDNVVVEPSYRIRKLTPRETWRLTGFSDSDFDRAKWYNKDEAAAIRLRFAKKRKDIPLDQKIERVSDSQLYKQAGNSIVVTVLEEIFNQMM